MSLVEKLPKVNWPQRSGIHKVVQLEIDNKPYLRFGEGLVGGYHASILQETLRTLGIPCDLTLIDTHPTGMVGIGEQRRQYKIPVPQGAGYRAVGMGYANVDLAKKAAEFYGMSEDYLLWIDQEHLDKIKALQPDWNIKSRV